MKRLILFLVTILLLSGYGYAQKTTLQKQGTATQLVVDGKPFLVLGGELGNSAAGCVQDIETIFPKLQRMGLNTVLVPAYWDLLEPSEGNFDFTLTDKVLDQARKNDLKVIFLWFGAWKNSMSCYAPIWFKENYKKYPRAYTKSGKPLEIASSFSDEVWQADNRAFSKWLQHIAENDKEEGTVIMIQIENEIGMLEEARDYSDAANKAFNAPVPEALTTYLQKNKKSLHPQMLKKWESQNCPKQGTWQEMFGADIYTDEIFMAWYYALYVEKMAQSARSIYNIPLYVNAAMNSRGRKPGEYPSAGPLAHLIDVWHCGAPSIDLLAPDLYDTGFTGWVKQYDLPNNPLFIPEIRMNDNVGARAFYVFGEHNSMGFSPFSIERASDAEDALLVQSYRKLNQLMPLILQHQGKGTMRGFLLSQEENEQIIVDDDLTLTCRHALSLMGRPAPAQAQGQVPGQAQPQGPGQAPGQVQPQGPGQVPFGMQDRMALEAGGIILKLSKYEYIVAGSGFILEFAKNSEKEMNEKQQLLGEDGFAQEGSKEEDNVTTVTKWKGPRCGIGFVDEVEVNKDGSLNYIRRMNGDEDHQGRHVRIHGEEFSILHVKLYEYE